LKLLASLAGKILEIHPSTLPAFGIFAKALGVIEMCDLGPLQKIAGNGNLAFNSILLSVYISNYCLFFHPRQFH